MVKFVRFCLFVLLSSRVISQNLNVAEHQGVDATGEMVSINSKSYQIGSTKNSCCSSGCYVRCINDSARTLFVKFFGTQPINSFGRLIKTNDQALLVSGHSDHSCDTGPHSDFIAKIDTNGTLIFLTTSPSSSFIYPRFVGITQHPDSSYYVVTNDKLHHYSASGQLIFNVTPGITGMTSILALSNGSLLVNGIIGGVRYNIIMSPTGTIVSQQTCSDTVTKFYETPNYILGKTSSGIIEKYSSQLILLGNSTSGLNPASFIINDFTWINDSIFVTGNYGPSQSPFYAVFGPGFAVYFQSFSPYKGIMPTGIGLTNNNTIHIVTTSCSKSTPAYPFSSLYRFKVTGTFHSVSDIGVTSFSNLNTVLLGNGSSYMRPYIDLKVNVKNFGTDTVRSFFLNYYAYLNGGISYCYILLHKFWDTIIPPGSIITIPTGSFYGQPYWTETPGSSSVSAKQNICIFTSVPNSKNDIDTDNDAFCDSVLFTVTGLKENNLADENIDVFPNPFNSSFQVRAEFEIKSVEVVNALGLLLKKQIVGTKETEMKLGEFSDGIYFIKIETEKGAVTKKVLKQ